jgi:radical SAM protein with 4Fe4S-binding SPASM domain
MISLSRLLLDQLRPYDAIRYAKRASGADDPKPIVVFNYTHRCNLLCHHCYINATHPLFQDGTPKIAEPDTATCRRVIDSVAEYGAPVLLFSGGEPLMRKDLEELGTYAKNQGLRTVISSNGTMITKERAEKIKEAGFSYVGVSLDGLEAMNDHFRGVDGSFRKALAGISELKKAEVRVGLRFTITKQNRQDIPALFPLLAQEGIDRICFYHLVPSGRGEELKEILLTTAEIRETMDQIHQLTRQYGKSHSIEVLTVDNHADAPYLYLKLKQENPKLAEKVRDLLENTGGNASGERIASIDATGTVHPDQFMRHYVAGNIFEQSFTEIWGGQGQGILKELRSREDKIHGRCAKCQFFSLCRGNFRARAEGLTGDLWASDPGCYLTDEEIGL